MSLKKKSSVLTVLAFLVGSFSPGAVFSQSDFYKGKTITILQGREPGALGDMRVRAVMPYLQKFIPGNPTIVTEFMTGGGGRKATNHVYRSVRPDGLTLGNVGAGLIANAILGEPGVQYDIDKLIFLGSPNSATHYVYLSHRNMGFDSLEKLRAASGIRIGAQTVGHDIYMNGRLFAWLVGLKEPKFITGYSGTEIDLALMRGEVDARAQTAAWLLHRNREWLDKQLVNTHAILEIPKGDKHPHFGHLPELESFARSEKEKKVVQMFRAFRLAGSPYILPPGTPKERVDIIQEAMRRTFKDPQFRKEFKKLTGDDPTPLMPEAHEKVVKQAPRDPEVIGTFKVVAGADPLPAR